MAVAGHKLTHQINLVDAANPNYIKQYVIFCCWLNMMPYLNHNNYEKIMKDFPQGGMVIMEAIGYQSEYCAQLALAAYAAQHIRVWWHYTIGA